MGQALFKPIAKSESVTFDHVPLMHICYISKGMVLHSHERRAPGEFKAEDLVSSIEDKKHPVPYVDGTDIQRWSTTKTHYLEYGTKRSPAKLSRPTFPQLFNVGQKLISMDIATSRPVVTLDESQLHHNQSAWSFVPWHLLKGVKNRSIKKSALYKCEVTSATMPPITRDELEACSKMYLPEYLVAVMNSSYAQRWLGAERRNRLHLYPDDWKMLPIPVARKVDQERIKTLVVKLRKRLVKNSGDDPVELEQEIDSAVDAIILGGSD
jgi:hypothetical protein